MPFITISKGQSRDGFVRGSVNGADFAVPVGFGISVTQTLIDFLTASNITFTSASGSDDPKTYDLGGTDTSDSAAMVGNSRIDQLIRSNVALSARDYMPEIFNYDPAYLARAKSAFNSTMAGDSRTRVVCAGPSTCQGAGAGNSGLFNVNGARARSWPTFTGKSLTAFGMPARSDSFWGMSSFGTGAAYTGYDPRVTAANWVPNIATIGSGFFESPNSITTPLRFTPTGTWDRADIYYAQYPSAGVATTNIDGVTNTGINAAAGANALLKMTLNAASLGTHYVEVARASGGPVDVLGIDCYSSAVPDVAVWNVGFGGATSAQFASANNVWDAIPALKFLAPHLTVVEIGINDWRDAGVGVEVFRANMTTFIDAAKISGDVIIVAPFPSKTDRASVAQQAAYIQVLFDLAVSKSCVLINMTRRMGSWAAANARGDYFDELHPNVRPYANLGGLITGLVVR